MSAYQVPRDPTAVLGRRLLAWIVDGLLAYGIGIAVLLATTTWTETSRSCTAVMNAKPSTLCFTSGSSSLYTDSSSIAPAVGVMFVYWLLALIILQGLTGASPGKFVCGVRVVREDGRACGIGKAFIRSILWIVDGIGCGVPLVGPITAMATKGHRRVGDMAAKTFVVGRRDVGTPVVIPGLTAPAVAAGAPVGAYAVGAPAAPLGSPASAVPGAQPTPDSQWDPQRGTWVRYDQDLQAWYGLNQDTGQWYTL